MDIDDHIRVFFFSDSVGIYDLGKISYQHVKPNLDDKLDMTHDTQV